MKTKTIRTLVDVNLSNIENLKQGVDLLNSLVRKADRNIFNIALLGCYLIGVEIPFHDVTDGTHFDSSVFKHAYSGEDFTASRKKLCMAVGRNKSTVSKWIRAMELIIAEGHFHEFASGKRIFKVEVLARIESYREKLIVNGNYKLSDLLAMDAKDVNKIIDSLKDQKPQSSGSNKDKDKNKDADVTLNSNVFKWEHEGVMYEIPIEDMVKFAAPYKVVLEKEEKSA